MINKLTNFTNKSFKNYTNPNDLLFREKNIVFGYNGKGKSALAIGIKEEYLKNKSKNNNNFRLFNKEYIKKSLLLEDSEEKIKGVEASFSETDVETKTKINKLEKEIVSEDEIGKLNSEIEKIKKETRTEIDSIHERKKGKANIQKKSSKETIKKVIELYENDYEEAKKIEADDNKLSKISGDDALEIQIKQFDSLNQLHFSELSENDIDDIKVIFNEKYGDDIDIPEYEIVQWMNRGLEIHQESDECKFCGGKLDYREIKSKIEQYIENKKHKAIEKINSFKEHLQGLQKEIEKIESTSKTYIAIVGNTLEKEYQCINDCKKDLEFAENSIQSKIDRIENIVNFDFEKLNTMSSKIKISISTIKDKKDTQLTELRKKQNNLEILVKGAIGLEIINSQSINGKVTKIEIREADLKNKQETNKIKQEEIQNLKLQKSLTKDFAIYVSDILKGINISLKVEVDTDNCNYIIKSSHEDVLLTINDISEGEKNLLALLFFYYELFNDNKQQQVKPEIELIIADDPISSMDDSNRFYILELIKYVLNLPNQQVFILTHSWDDFYNLSFGKKNWDSSSKYATFEIKKNSGKSELVKSSSHEKPYKHLFKEIYDFSQKQEELIGTDCEIFHFPNVMRRIFEEWYSFKIGKNINLTSAQQEHLTNVFNLTNDNDKTKLGILLKVCNILSHSINTSRNPQEIHQSAKFLMKLIEMNDKLHFDNLKQ
jgi:wobble nucleotide-excising tRNase